MTNYEFEQLKKEWFSPKLCKRTGKLKPRVTLWLNLPLPQNLRFMEIKGEKAWKKLYNLSPPNWKQFKQDRKLYKKWFSEENPSYKAIIKEEREANQLEFYKTNGMVDTVFCAIVEKDSQKGVLVDGNHRFINLNHIIDTVTGFKLDCTKCVLQILEVEDIARVLPLDAPC